MQLQVSVSHMQVLETAAGNNFLCSMKEISRKAESFVNRRRRKSLEREKRDMENTAEALHFNTGHYQSSQTNRTK